MTDEEYYQKLAEIDEENKQIEYRRSLRRERLRLYPKVKIETSKLLAIYVFVLLNAIIIYAMVSMWRFSDLSYLGILITDIAAQVVVYAIYCLKAYKAKKSEEDMKFAREQLASAEEGPSEEDFVC